MRCPTFGSSLVTICGMANPTVRTRVVDMQNRCPPLVTSLDLRYAITPTVSGRSPTGSQACCRFGIALAVLLGALPGCRSLIVTQRSVESLAGQRGFEWHTHNVDGFVVYFERGSAASRDLEAIGADAMYARRRVHDYVGGTAYEPTVSIFVVDTRARMKDLIGRSSNATAYYTSNALCLVWADTWRVGATHELFHVVAMNRWGVPHRWVNEGMAVDCAGPWRGLDPHAVCKLLRSRGELPSLSEFTRRFDRLPGLVAYPAAGSFVRYVRVTHGIEALRQVWQGGRTDLPAATGLRMDELEAAWLAMVDQADTEGIKYEVSAAPTPCPKRYRRLSHAILDTDYLCRVDSWALGLSPPFAGGFLREFVVVTE